MNIEERLKVVKLNEIECETHASRARESWTTLKTTAKASATPWRIVTVGAIAGFLMGRSGGGAAVSSGSSIGTKLFGTVAEMLVTSLGAAGAAGASAAAAADAAAAATTDAVAAGAATPEGRVAAAAQLHDEAAAELEPK